MSDYRQTAVTGTSYTRGRSMYFENPSDGIPSLLVREEQVTTLADRTLFEPCGEIRKAVTDFSVSFPLRDPSTSGIIPGATMTYQDLFVGLYSLYWHLAQERDAFIPPTDQEQVMQEPV